MVLFGSWMTAASLTPATGARWGLGATDNTTEVVSTLVDENAVGGFLKTSTSAGEFAHAFHVADSFNYTAVGEIKSGTGGSFDSDGFTVDWTANSDNVATEINYLALGPLSATAVALTSFTATLTPDGRTLIKWRTGYEVDNVGFRVYREQNGRRVRITSSIVPGTALIGAGPGASAGGRIYTWSDGTAPSEGVRYWLEDIDLKGKHTWHGPIVPAPASPRVPQQ